MHSPEFDSLLPVRPYDRRAFFRTALGSGFAAAVLPVGAQTIRTDSEGLAVGEVTVPVGDFKLPAYRAMPAAAAGPLPTVLVVSEIFGVHEHIADVARRFAKRGYLAIAPELFARQGDPGSYGEISRLLSEVIDKVPDAQVLGDLDACAHWAAANGGDAGRLGITGFCWGGRIVWLYAAHNPALKAGVAWYGRLAGERKPLTPRQPIDLAGELHAPVLGLYGAKDQGIPLADVERMRAALSGGSAAAKRSEIHVYAEAGHAFNADYRATYVKAAADDGWRRCLDWFATHGVAAR
ncbi:MAG: dienelactone hydrolase family protein [Betaproteobacteria bacterium]